jgi:hypothetical protein
MFTKRKSGQHDSIEMGMSSYDLIDFLLENNRWKKIYPINKIKTAISSPDNIESVREMFKNVGNCIVTGLAGPGAFEQLRGYYLPWYWPDTKQIGAGQYVNQIMNKNLNLPGYHEVSSLIKSLREGWKTEIEIIIAFDTIIRSGVVVDGTKHLLALLVIKEQNHELLTRLLKRSAPVKHCKMISSECRSIFHEDFKM